MLSVTVYKASYFFMHENKTESKIFLSIRINTLSQIVQNKTRKSEITGCRFIFIVGDNSDLNQFYELMMLEIFQRHQMLVITGEYKSRASGKQSSYLIYVVYILGLHPG